MSKPATLRSYWREALRSIKRAILSRTQVSLAGCKYCIAYEGRRLREEDDYAILADLAKNRACVFDIGANIGLTSLVMVSRMQKGGALYAFEASEAACLIVHENAMLNGFEHSIRIVNTLVTEKSGEVIDFNWNFIAGNASLLIDSPSGTQIPLAKTSISLDDYIGSYALSPDFVKIDVEGAEASVLMGMKNILLNHRPPVYIEVHGWPTVSLAKNLSHILSILDGCQYHLHDVIKKQRLEVSTNLHKANSSKYSRIWTLALPAEIDFSSVLQKNI